MRKLASIERMASRIMKCGTNKLWFDPNEYEKIMAAQTIQQVKDLIAEDLILKKDDKVNSRAKAEKRLVAKNKGRHMGAGSKKGTKNARLPQKTIWIKTIRSMRAVLLEMKNKGELSSEDYHMWRQQAKGNQFKLNKNTMIDTIAKKKQEQTRLAELEKQAAALKMKTN